MNTQDYILCEKSFFLETGSLIASYNFNNQVGSVILNDLYTTGECYYISGGDKVFNLDKHNLAILKTGSGFSSSFTGYFSGEEYAFILTDQKLTGFSALLDFNFNNCSSNSDQVLFSSASGSSLASGLILGVSRVNRLFLEYGIGQGKRIHTCDFNISKNNIIGLSMTSGSFTVSKYDSMRKSLTKNSFTLDPYLPSDKAFFFKSFNSYSGFSGKVNQIFVSNTPGSFDDVYNYECSFCSGMETGINVEQYPLTGFDPLSIYGESVFEMQITGLADSFSSDPIAKVLISKAYDLSGLVEIAPNITGDLVVTTGYLDVEYSIPHFDNQKITNYSDIITINFLNPLESGDLLDVYDYSGDSKDININGDPGVGENIALFSNGMLLISGLDYEIANGVIESSFDESDEVVFNYIEKKIDYLIYSGLYDSYKQPTGTGSFTGYYPSSSQYLESGDGNITVTGFGALFYEGFTLLDYDLFMNGQKLYTGVNYSTGVYGGEESLIIHAQIFNDAKLAITTGSQGELISVDEQTESILAFCPVQTGSIIRKATFLTSATPSYPVSGMNEEVWLNGIKLINKVDYSKTFPCSSYSYNFNIKDLPYIFCKENDTFFNIS